MPNFNPIRINLENLSNTPILDGQLLFVTNQDDGKNPIYLDIGSTRKAIGLHDWSEITNKPFNTIGNGLSVDSNGILSTNVTWSGIINKPFNTIGNGLNVNTDNELVIDAEWSDISNKPFISVGTGLSVNTSNELVADAQNWNQITNKPFSSVGTGLSIVGDTLVVVGGGTGVDWDTEVINKPFETIGGGLKVVNGVLETDVTVAWSSVTNKPFNSIGSGLIVAGGALTADFNWNGVSNKPFNTIGNGLTVDGSGALKTDITFSWSDVINKPFNTIGTGLTVNLNNELIADIQTVTLTTIGTASYNTVATQNLTINGSTNYEILGTKYMERTLTLNTSSSTVFDFTSDEILSNSVIDVIGSIYDINPSNITVTENVGQGTYTVSVTYPPYDTAGTSMLCRIYIR